MSRFRLISFAVAVEMGCWMVLQTPAHADLRLCNITSSRVGIAIGYKSKDAWRTEGWWNIKPNACETVLNGNLTSRFYYVYAQDYDRGGEWTGTSAMCTHDRQFTIDGIEDCLARGFNRTKFFEVDTGEQKNWTVQLTDPTRTPTTKAPQRLP